MLEALYELELLMDKRDLVEHNMKKEISFVLLRALKVSFEGDKSLYREKETGILSLQKKIHDDEAICAEKKCELDELTKQLYDGEITKPSELSLLQEQVNNYDAQYKSLLAMIDDKKLLVLQQKEELDNLMDQLKALKLRFYTEKDSVNERKKVYDNKINVINKEIKKKRASISKDQLKWFDEKALGFSGRPLAILMPTNACSRCHTVQSVITAIAVKDAKETYCENCQRRLISIS